jgi:carbonic anhydrase
LEVYLSNASIPKTTSKSIEEVKFKRMDVDKFLCGYKKFHSNYFANNYQIYKELRNTQAPKMLMISCCDSRVDPAIITQCDPGDIFVVRNVANVVAPYSPDGKQHGTSAAIEYAVKVLNVKNMIVMGHSKCGGM